MTDVAVLRLVMPDRWLEEVVELPLSVSVAEAKAVGLRSLLQRDSDDPAGFYVEFRERKVRDEEQTLAALGAGAGSILMIRAYDLGHYPPFEG
jgi:hypothetical protein